MNNTHNSGNPATGNRGLLQTILPGLNSDMRLVGLFYIIYGAFSCLTIIGAVFGIPLIIMGARLRDAARAFDDYRHTHDPAALQVGFEKQSTFFFIQKVIILVMLGLLVLYLFVLYYVFSSGFWDRFQDNDMFETWLPLLQTGRVYS